MLNLKEKLEVILITYNRKKHLKRTLEQIFADNSPIKDLNITILDNKSTDGSTELIDEYCQKFPNVNHVIHPRNIGGNANVARAFEISKQEYLWVICDDDLYYWDNWYKVEKAIEENKDAIVLANHNITDPNNISDIVFQMTFLPSTIYKTSFLTQETIENIYYNVSNMFPHVPVGISIINAKGKIVVLDTPIVKNGYEQAINAGKPDDAADVSYTRGTTVSKLYPNRKNMPWYVAYINSLTLLEGKNVFTEGIKSALTYPLLGKNLQQVVRHIVNSATLDKRSINLYYDFFCRVNWKIKLIMIYYRYVIGFIHSIFSLKNIGNHKVLTILGIKIKMRRKKKV